MTEEEAKEIVAKGPTLNGYSIHREAEFFLKGLEEGREEKYDLKELQDFSQNMNMTMRYKQNWEQERQHSERLAEALKALKRCVEEDPDVRIQCPAHLVQAKEALGRGRNEKE